MPFSTGEPLTSPERFGILPIPLHGQGFVVLVSKPKTKPCVECTRPIYQNGAGNWRHADTKKIFCFPGQPSYARPADEPVELGTAAIWNTDDDQWFVDLELGDLVVEQSTFHRAEPESHLKGFGILIAERREWWQTDEEYATEIAEDPEIANEERATDHAWYVQYGSNKEAVCRWTNCSFLVVPVFDTFTQPVGIPDGKGVTITRDSLIGSLADAGFSIRD